LNLIEDISALLSLLMMIPVFIGMLLLIKNSSFKNRLTAPLSQLVFFNTLVYSALLVLSAIDLKGLIGLVVLSFLMLPTYLLLLYGRYVRWNASRIRPVKKFTNTDRIKLRIRRKARVKYQARIESRERARKKRQKRL